jgi:hypothetical protein
MSIEWCIMKYRVVYQYVGWVHERIEQDVGRWNGHVDVQAGDLTFLEDMAKWMSNTGDGNDGLHNPVPHVAFWCWNANSGDTGGIVADDWLTVRFRIRQRYL